MTLDGIQVFASILHDVWDSIVASNICSLHLYSDDSTGGRKYAHLHCGLKCWVKHLFILWKCNLYPKRKSHNSVPSFFRQGLVGARLGKLSSFRGQVYSESCSRPSPAGSADAWKWPQRQTTQSQWLDVPADARWLLTYDLYLFEFYFEFYFVYFVVCRDAWECKQFFDYIVCVWTRLGLNHTWTHTLKTVDHGHVPTWICEWILWDQGKAAPATAVEELREEAKPQGIQSGSFSSFFPKPSKIFRNLQRLQEDFKYFKCSRLPWKVPVYFHTVSTRGWRLSLSGWRSVYGRVYCLEEPRSNKSEKVTLDIFSPCWLSCQFSNVRCFRFLKMLFADNFIHAVGPAGFSNRWLSTNLKCSIHHNMHR